jgi:hypothetical protein
MAADRHDAKLSLLNADCLRKFAERFYAMSALLPKADITERDQDVRFVP